MWNYSEIFYSIQGEGLHVGIPSVFLRLFGCNFQCQGFGMPRGELSTERLDIDPKKYDKFEDLPLVTTGCDSYASWDARFKHLITRNTTDELINKLIELLPNNEWITNDLNETHLVITGGEPLLKGHQKKYPELFTHPRMVYLRNVTFETNCTQPITDSFNDYLGSELSDIEFTFSCSPKLPVSGESWDTAIKSDVASSYFRTPNSRMYFKFVVSSERDMEDVDRAVSEYRKEGIDAPVYLMPVGGCYDEYQSNTRTIAQLAMERGWRYSPRLHVDIFGNSWGT